MILEEETFEAFGYYPKDLKPKSNKPILVACDDCNKVRILYKYAYSPLCMSCSRRGARGPGYGIDHRGAKNPNWNGGPVKCICEACGKEFDVEQRRIKRGDGKYCCISCARKGKPLSEEHKHNISEATKGVKHPNFGKQLNEEHRYNISKNHADVSGDKNPNYGKRGALASGWRGGISFEPYCQKFNKSYKVMIRERFNNKCFLCSKNAEENGRTLDVHHVNYNKDCGCDRSKCICVPLCRSCHMRTNGHRKYWYKKIMDKLKNTLPGYYS